MNKTSITLMPTFFVFRVPVLDRDQYRPVTGGGAEGARPSPPEFLEDKLKKKITINVPKNI